MRILVPFVAGIVLYRFMSSMLVPVALTSVAAIVFTATALAIRRANPMLTMKLRSMHITYIALIACALGWGASYINEPATVDTHSVNHHTVIGRIDNIDYTDFSMSMRITLLNYFPSKATIAPISNHPTIELSSKGCDYRLQLGQLIAFNARLDSVRNLGNPDEMDYADYLHRQGIVFTQHLLSTDSLRAVGYAPTVMNRMGNVRTWLQRQITATQLSEPLQNFVIALVLGKSRFIDYDTRQQFSNAGVAHLLALSGLHVGIISMILWWILFPLDYLRLKKLRLAITMVLLVVFDAFTGMPSSVVRATVMTGFVAAAIILYRKSQALNALATAALVILAFSPSSLHDAGFQLSFITVGAILVFGKKCTHVSRRRRVAYYIYSTVTISAIASASTLTLSAHYFHSISLMGVIANMVILPTFPIFMTLCIIFTVLCALGTECQIVDWLLSTYYKIMKWFIELINSIPLSHINDVWVTDFAVWASFGIIICLAIWIYSSQRRWLLASAAILAVSLAHSAYTDWNTPHHGLIVFNSYDSTPVVYFNSGKAVAWVPDNEEFNLERFARSNAGFMAHYRIKSIRRADSLKTDGVFISYPFAYMEGTRLMAIGRGKWKHMVRQGHTEVDAALVSKKFHSNIAIADTLYSIRKYVLSGDLYGPELDSVRIALRKLHRPVHDIARDGAFTVFSKD